MASLESLRNFRQGWHKVSIELISLPNASSCAWRTGNPNNTAVSEFEAEKGLLQGQARRWMAHAPRHPKLPEGFQQSTFFFFFLQHSTFKGPVREEHGWLLHRSGHDVPANLQQDKWYIALFYKSCRANMTKHRQQNTRVKVKGTDIM